ncbi:DUF898 domain-containing protein [Rhodospirillaceae bacterium KN72]|uniref:DUF898 domain-containing protein n=1 Tax=Pacificispira spongiicola TaxID=2729598 RepID=A0A7Y0HFQ1_9PROT|nr:YjgN family protein [Pacificispira spongiicola]NMM44137.1 DUF898 domain-containing protein [Pacificispira spongiicola]
MDGSIQTTTPSERRLKFVFTGQSKDYFLICLRTFLLAVVTLGIYDAWGTVERRRYLLGHTKLDGHGFDYHARPITILIGRLIAVAAIVGYNVMAYFQPGFMSGFLSMAFIFGMPWLVIRALRFQLRNTSYRNVRFDFVEDYSRAFKAFILAPILIPLSLCLAWPWVQRVGARFIADNMRFGDRAFSLDMRLWKVYLVFFSAIACGIAAIVIGVLMNGSFSEAWTVTAPLQVLISDAQPMVIPVGSIICTVVVIFLIAVCFTVYKAAFRNAVLNGVTLAGGHRFSSTIPIIRYGFTLCGIWFLASISIGLLIPWATIWSKRLQTNYLVMVAAGSLDEFKSHGEDGGNAAATELGSLEGITDGLLGGTF